MYRYTQDTVKIYKEGLSVFYSNLDEFGGDYIRSDTTNNYCIILFTYETKKIDLMEEGRKIVAIRNKVI